MQLYTKTDNLLAGGLKLLFVAGLIYVFVVAVCAL
jgi:hypothetical protein